MRLRIISGDLKGRFIKAPATNNTRPTTDRVRETLFNILENLMFFDNRKVLDLYAGSGSLGFECLSRGAEHVTFVEEGYKAYKNLIVNANDLQVAKQCSFVRSSVMKFTAVKPEEPFSLILADPPFYKYDIYKVVEQVFMNEVLRDDGMMVIERSVQTIEKDSKAFQKEAFRKIGDTRLYSFSYV